MTTPRLSTDLVWSRLSDDLRRFIRRRVSDDHLADDLLQETFIRIHRNIGTLSGAERVAAWVYQIARNVIHDHYRKASPNEVEIGEPAAPDEDRMSHLRDQATGWLEEIIRELPETYQDAVRLAEMEGLTQQAVAERLGLSLPGAKSRIQRGRVALRSALDDCCRFEFDRRGNLMGCEPKPGRRVCLDCDE